MTARLRAAPAPTGELHVGNVRTFLFNWLYARHIDGTFILRIEDTDRARFAEEHYLAVLEDLKWLGLDWDEGPEVGGAFGPYRQSERIERHREGVMKLLDKELAYRCYCTPERLEELRAQQRAAGQKPEYDRKCLDLSGEEIDMHQAAGDPWIARFNVPPGKTSFTDLVVGEVTVDNEEIDDFVIMRSDGTTLYNMSVVMDDGDMGITHVVRGDDHLSNTPKQILLHEALGNAVPQFAHVPQVVGPDRKPLAKRHGSTAVGEFRNAGYLPEALLNHLALLGWGTADDTILSKEELIERFDIEHVHASPAMFDFQKLDWMNGEYIRMMSDAEVSSALEPWLGRADLVGIPPTDEEKAMLDRIAPLIKTRIRRLDEAADYCRPLFGEIEMANDSFQKWMTQPHVPDLLDRALGALRNLDAWTAGAIEETLRAIQEEMDLKRKTAFMPFFVSVTGTSVSLPIFDVMALLGKQKTIERIERGRARV